MRYMKIGLSLLLLCMMFIGCPKKQVVEPVEEPIVEETPFEEIELPVEPVEPPKPELVLNMIFFDFDKSDIRVDAADILQGDAEMLKIYPDIKVTIEGHCCEIGTAEYNLALGERRAHATRDYLLMLGITPDRLSTVSYGEEKPLDPKKLELNRRAEFTVQ
jgi:peptidoglycan-associated lipoprotein